MGDKFVKAGNAAIAALAGGTMLAAGLGANLVVSLCVGVLLAAWASTRTLLKMNDK